MISISSMSKTSQKYKDMRKKNDYQIKDKQIGIIKNKKDDLKSNNINTNNNTNKQ